VISPDGSMIAFAATDLNSKTTIWVRPTNSLDAHQVKDTDGAIFPFWSFDSRSIAFFADGKLKVVEISGGSAQVIADAGYGRGGAWGTDGIIVYAPVTQDRLYRINANGGTPTPLTTSTSISTRRIAGHFFSLTASICSILRSTTMPRNRQTTRSTTLRSMAA
jgi:hypothetical protein